jgi:hypothetical protein
LAQHPLQLAFSWRTARIANPPVEWKTPRRFSLPVNILAVADGQDHHFFLRQVKDYPIIANPKSILSNLGIGEFYGMAYRIGGIENQFGFEPGLNLFWKFVEVSPASWGEGDSH